MSPDLFIPLGRLLLAAPFVFAGVRHAFAYPSIVPTMAERGMPRPLLMLALASTFEVVCGLLLAAGLWVVPVAIGLIGFTVVVSVVMLNFWAQPPGPARKGAMNAFVSNFGILGGLLLVIAVS